ncbi:MAG TPA: hypothetical protein VJ717_10360 [Gemmatimonadaceae bacterium]|nr:hypothetical protein [Gemmatimonadaceae bacterium]
MRRIITAQLQDTGPAANQIDDFADRILKYIPAEIVAAWVALTGLLTGLAVMALWIIFVIVAVLTFFYMKRQTDLPGKPPATTQNSIGVLSFIVWAFALHSGPFGSLTYPAAYGSIALILYTLAIGLVVPKEGS